METSQLWSDKSHHKCSQDMNIDDTPSFLGKNRAQNYLELVESKQKLYNISSNCKGNIEEIDCTPIQRANIEGDCTPFNFKGTTPTHQKAKIQEIDCTTIQRANIEDHCKPFNFNHSTPNNQEVKASFLSRMTSFERPLEGSPESEIVNLSLLKPGFSNKVKHLSGMTQSLKYIHKKTSCGEDSNPTRSTLRDSLEAVFGNSCEGGNTTESSQKESEKKVPYFQRRNSKKGACLGLNIYGMKKSLASCGFIQIQAIEKVEAKKRKPKLTKQLSSVRNTQESPTSAKVAGLFKSEKFIKMTPNQKSLNQGLPNKKAIRSTLEEFILNESETDIAPESLLSELNLIEKFSLPSCKLLVQDSNSKILQGLSNCEVSCTSAIGISQEDSRNKTRKSLKPDYKGITLDSILKLSTIYRKD